MIQDEDSELVKLIKNEIALGFTFMESHRLSSSAEHSAQARDNARNSLETAKRFAQKLAGEGSNAFEPELRRLEGLIASEALD